MFAQQKEHVSDHLRALHYHLILTRQQVPQRIGLYVFEAETEDVIEARAPGDDFEEADYGDDCDSSDTEVEDDEELPVPEAKDYCMKRRRPLCKTDRSHNVHVDDNFKVFILGKVPVCRLSREMKCQIWQINWGATKAKPKLLQLWNGTTPAEGQATYLRSILWKPNGLVVHSQVNALVRPTMCWMKSTLPTLQGLCSRAQLMLTPTIWFHKQQEGLVFESISEENSKNGVKVDMTEELMEIGFEAASRQGLTDEKVYDAHVEQTESSSEAPAVTSWQVRTLVDRLGKRYSSKAS